MADLKITQLGELTTVADADLLAIVDATDTTTKKITRANFLDGVGGGVPLVINLTTLYDSSTTLVGYSDVVSMGMYAAGELNLLIENIGLYYVTTSTLKSTYNRVDSYVLLGDYVYFLLTKTGDIPDSKAVVRVPKTDIKQAGTDMTFSGAVVLANTDSIIRMTSDGTYIFLNFQAGNNASSEILSKFSISGTTLTYVSDITFDRGQAVHSYVAKADGTFMATIDNALQQIGFYDASGVYQGMRDNIVRASTGTYLHVINDNVYATYAGVGTRLFM